MTNLLPFRMRLIHHLATAEKPLTGQDLLASLTVEYGRERQCNLNAVMDNLFNLMSLGLVSMADERLDEDQNLVILFSITEDGLACNKYYPAAWHF